MSALEKMYPELTDFGLAQRGDEQATRFGPIQPDRCNAPEVILGTGWSYSADIWNLGLLACIAILLPFTYS